MLNDPNIGPHFALLQIHIGDSYSTTWGNQRDTFYNITGTPTAWFDGITSVVGAGSIPSAQAAYTAKYNQRRGVPTNVAITVTGVQQSGPTFTIRANVCVEPTTPRNMRLYMAAVLDHYPTSPSYSRWCFRQATSTQDVNLSPGQCYLFTRTITFDSTSWANQPNIKVVVWAQVPNNVGPAEIFNSAVLSWPFGPDCNANGIPDDSETDCNGNDIPDDCDIAGGAPDCNTNGIPDSCELADNDCNGNGIPDDCDIAGGAPDCDANGIPDSCELAGNDCNANGILDSCDIASGYSADANGNGIPDECEFTPGDVNCDGAINFGDINPFVLALTSPSTYEEAFPDCNILSADINGDGRVNFGDINPFVALLTQ